MIKVDKDFEDIPNILTINPKHGKSREEIFNANILASNYVDNGNKYKVPSIQKRLKEIYRLKCAYCEKKLLDSPKHIEHYRPKKGGYYWLAYSWDNLLLSCGECNNPKDNNFPIKGTKVRYNNETFEMVQGLGKVYDEQEKPQIINPEKEDIMDKICFDNKGKIFSDDERVQKTIDVCKIDRDELSQLRNEILVNFRQEMEAHYQYYILKKDTSRFVPTLEQFIKNCKKENSFFAFRNYILENIELFFENKNICNIIKHIQKRRKTQ